MSTIGRRAQEFAGMHIARFARGGYLRTEFGDALEEFARQENVPVLECLRQYVDDLRYPPTGDSIQRRIERAERVIAALDEARSTS